jgi:hypothetical protein
MVDFGSECVNVVCDIWNNHSSFLIFFLVSNVCTVPLLAILCYKRHQVFRTSE